MKKRFLSSVLAMIMMIGMVSLPTLSLAASESLPFYQWSEKFDDRISTGTYVADEWDTGYTAAGGVFHSENVVFDAKNTSANTFKLPGGQYIEVADAAYKAVASDKSSSYGKASKYWFYPGGTLKFSTTNPSRQFTAPQAGSIIIYAVDADGRIAIDTKAGVTPNTPTKIRAVKNNSSRVWTFEDTSTDKKDVWNYHRFVNVSDAISVKKGDKFLFVFDDTHLTADNYYNGTTTSWTEYNKMPIYWDPVVAYIPSDRANGTKPLTYENVGLGQKFTENYGVAITRDNIEITGSENAKVSTFSIDENNNATFSFDSLMGGYTYVVRVKDPADASKSLDTFVIKTADNFYQASAYYDDEIRYTAGSTTNGKSIWNGAPSFPFFSRYDNPYTVSTTGGNNYDKSEIGGLFGETTVFYTEGETISKAWRYSADNQGGVEKYWMYSPQSTDYKHLVSRVWRAPSDGYIAITCRDDLGNQNIKGRKKNATSETFATKLSVRNAGVGGFYANKATALWEGEVKPGETVAFKTITMPVKTNQRIFFTIDGTHATTTAEYQQALVYWDPVVTYIPGVDYSNITFAQSETNLTTFEDVINANAEGDVKITVPVTPYDMSGKSIIGAAAVYDGEGNLVNCAFGTQTTLGTDSVNLEITLPKINAVVSSGCVKVFLFSDIESITPLSGIGSIPVLLKEP